uniref:Enoyl reductase (ER) domain-containing protein n=2 Tax=Oryza glumipatula TaxID=40148 RepID=A0A0E0B4X4_9ORYZ
MATSSRRMRAVQYDKYGGGAQALKHVDVPIPTPKKGEVLIKMEAGSINQVDWKFQKGVARPFMPNKFPFIPVYDLAGEVVELGRGVSSFKVGDKVIAINFPGGGGLAEYAVAQASRTAPRPPEVLDYATPEGAALRSPSGRRYDAVVHCAAVAGLPWSAFAPVLADAGVVVDLTPGAAAFATALRQRVTFSRKRLVPLFVSPTKEDMELVAGMVAEGKLRAVIESRHPLSRAEEGWARSMAGHATGKIIVEMGDEQ